MVNLLGDFWYDGEQYCELDWVSLYVVFNFKFYFYGKYYVCFGCKMGYFMVIGEDVVKVQEVVLNVCVVIGIKGE